MRHVETKEAQDYSDQFQAALIEAGWKVRAAPQFLIPQHQPSGLWVLVPDGDHPTDGANQLLSALEATPNLNAKGLVVPPLHNGTFELFVGFQEELKP